MCGSRARRVWVEPEVELGGVRLQAGRLGTATLKREKNRSLFLGKRKKETETETENETEAKRNETCSLKAG